MCTVVDWQETAGEISINQRVPIAARLFGIPFLAVGVYFLYQLLDGILHPSELTIAGWILLPVMTAAFLAPGWLLVAVRKRIRLEPVARRAIEEFDFRVDTRTTVTTVPAEARVMMRDERGMERKTRGAMTTHVTTPFNTHVYLVAGAKEILLAMLSGGERATAAAFAEKAAAAFAIRVEDRRFEHGEVNAAGVVVERLGPEDAD